MLCRKLTIGYNGRPTFTPKINSSHGPIPKPNYLSHPWTHQTYHFKPHLYLLSHFATLHWTDRHTHKPTDGWREYSMIVGRFCSMENDTQPNDNKISIVLFK